MFPTRFLALSFLAPLPKGVDSFSKRRRPQRERHQTTGSMSSTMVLHVRYESLYISLLSSAKQQREMTQMTKSRVFGERVLYRNCGL